MFIIYLQYILYNSQCCTRKKCVQHWCIYQLHVSYRLETSQGVQWDSLWFSAIKIGCIIAPDHCQRRQEAPKRIPATLAAFLCLPVHFLRRGGVWGRIYSSQILRCGWGGSKDKIHTGGQEPPGVSTHSPGPTALKLPRESLWTPWGSAPLKSGAYSRPIIADVARKRRSAF